MKILVYGSNGWIGNQFINILEKNEVVFFCGKSRVDELDSLSKEIEEIKPTHIVSFIGRTHGKIENKNYATIDYLEQEGKLTENVRDNLFSPLLLAFICTNKGIHYTYLGTGCIFKFDEKHPYGIEENGFTEDSLPNFFGSSYSIVKGFTDQFMHLYKDNVLNLRIRMPITGEKNGRNFITKIVNYEKVCSVPNSMTVLPELLVYVLDMMKQKISGTVNLTNPGLISHNEILEMYKEIVDPSFTWKNFSIEEQRKILAADRSNNYMDTHKFEELYPQVSNIKDSVKKCLVEYKNGHDKEVNLLITGGCGFIGSNFINYYFDKNKVNKIINLDAMYYCASESNVYKHIRDDPNYVFINGNLCDANLITESLQKHHITHVIHFAAQSHVQNSFEDSIKFTNDNILGTHTLLECCRKYKHIKKFIHVSTDEVYGESMNHVDETHKTEHSVLCPTNPYAATKAGAELIAQSYNHSYKMPIIITRGNNVYGRNQYPEKLIPKFVQLLKENKKVTIQGAGNSVRAFLHAYDTAKAFETILEKGEVGEIYNIGCDEGMEYSVLEIAHLLIKMIHHTEKYEDWIEYVEDRPYNDMRYYISNQKLKDLGWNIDIDLLTGLNDLIHQDYKINLIDLYKIENVPNKLNFFGDWINDVDKLQNDFSNAKPFEHIIIPNFFSKEYAELLYKTFPEDIDNGKWYKYLNPIEVKYAFDDIQQLQPDVKNAFHLLSTKEITEKIASLTNIPNLEYDPYLHGAGLHLHPRNGRLHVHLDYEKHPHLNKERRLNIILYLNKDWKKEWNGQTELWDKTMEKCVVKSEVVFNTAILFKTNEISWHGLPEKIQCPEGTFRKTLAYYYISPMESEASSEKIGNDGTGYRSKATFIKRPEDPFCEKIDNLYKIRPHRLITNADLDKLGITMKEE
jgi:dTDP-glucose 4,6-dehydratase